MGNKRTKRASSSMRTNKSKKLPMRKVFMKTIDVHEAMKIRGKEELDRHHEILEKEKIRIRRRVEIYAINRILRTAMQSDIANYMEKNR